MTGCLAFASKKTQFFDRDFLQHWNFFVSLGFPLQLGMPA